MTSTIATEGMKIDTPLKTLEVLILDCQTTGGRAESANLLEVGWSRSSAATTVALNQLPVISYLVQLPSGEKIPPPVSRLTGISDIDLTDGWSIDTVWRRLHETARSISNANRSQLCPTVIHFARFERPFLRQLHEQKGAASPFPFDIICTHEIAKRLLPELPRKGLRALAGYLGHTVPSCRRCAGHVTATMFIWQQLVGLLYRTFGIQSLSELKCWLARTPVVPVAAHRYPMPDDVRRALPDSPGVYHFMRSNGDLLYIGKAANLRQRVNSHFRKTGHRSEKSLEMLTQAAKLKIKPTASAVEAALLESEEIKRLRPPYNIALLPGNRRIRFLTHDFSHFSPAPDRRHRLGPVVNSGIFTALHAIGDSLTHPSGPRSALAAGDAALLLDLPERFCPSEACLLEGIEMFNDLHAPAFESKPFWRSLLAIGDRQLRLAKADLESIQEPPGGSPEEIPAGADDVRWSAEEVASRFEFVLGQCAHMLRRARWLMLLSESSLVWSSRRETMIGIVISGGQVIDRFETDTIDVPPVPPNYKRGLAARQRRTDLLAYDRLRVLMTNLRRLTSADRTVCLRIGKRRLLRETCLSEALQRV